MNKSAKCYNKNMICVMGNIIETIKDSTATRICECQCHDNMYKLVSRKQAANNHQLENHDQLRNVYLI